MKVIYRTGSAYLDLIDDLDGLGLGAAMWTECSVEWSELQRENGGRTGVAMKIGKGHGKIEGGRRGNYE